MIRAIFISALSISAFALGEERNFSPATSNNLRGPEKITTTEDASASADILFGAGAHLSAMKANIAFKLPADLLTREEDIETDGVGSIVDVGVSVSAQTFAADCVGGDWSQINLMKMGSCFSNGQYNLKMIAVLGLQTSTVKMDVFTLADETCSGTPIKRGMRFSRFHKCRPGGNTDEKGSSFFTGAWDLEEFGSFQSSFQGIVIQLFTDSSCSDDDMFAMQGLSALTCTPSYNEKGKLVSHNVYTGAEEVDGVIKVTFRSYIKEDPLCRLEYQTLTVPAWGDELSSSVCKPTDDGFYWKAMLRFPSEGPN